MIETSLLCNVYWLVSRVRLPCQARCRDMGTQVEVTMPSEACQGAVRMLILGFGESDSEISKAIIFPAARSLILTCNRTGKPYQRIY